MSPSCNSKIVPLAEVPLTDLTDESVPAQPRVLVVDDEPLVADTLSAILRRAGFAAHAAYSGAAALKLVAEVEPELLLTDVSMPSMNGIELALSLVAQLPACKVLLFSGHATSADLVAALDAGHDFPLLSKPMHPTDLLRHVSRTLHLPDLLVPERRTPKDRFDSVLTLRPALDRQYA